MNIPAVSIPTCRYTHFVEKIIPVSTSPCEHLGINISLYPHEESASNTERNDFVIGTNQGKTNVTFVKKIIDLLTITN